MFLSGRKGLQSKYLEALVLGAVAKSSVTGAELRIKRSVFGALRCVLGQDPSVS